MPKIHPTANIGSDVQLADDVEIGPSCTLTGRITIGPGTVLMGHNYLEGPLIIGAKNRIFPFSTFGLEPQDQSFTPGWEGAGLRIGDRNVFREQFSAHRATSSETPTRIGNENYLMASSHVAHDCIVGNHCVLSVGVLMGGRTEIEDQVNMGGSAAIGQNLRIGRLAFISGLVGIALTVPPFMMSRKRSSVGGINIVGLRRSGMERREVDIVKWMFRLMYLEGNTKPVAIARMRERAEEFAAVREMITFLTKREDPLCHLEPGKYQRHMGPVPEIEVAVREQPMVTPTRS